MTKWVSNRISQYVLLDDSGVHTGWFLVCENHWDSDEPITWAAVRHGQTFSFPTKAEAMSFAEVTYELECNP